MELDKQGKEEAWEVIEDFLRFAERMQQESEARVAESGEELKQVLIGVDPETPTLVVFGLDDGAEAGDGGRP